LSGRVADRETLTPLLESQGRWLAVSLFRPLGGSARGRVEPGAVYLLQRLSACCNSAQTRRASCCSLHALHQQFNRLPSVPSSAQFFLSGHNRFTPASNSTWFHLQRLQLNCISTPAPTPRHFTSHPLRRTATQRNPRHVSVSSPFYLSPQIPQSGNGSRPEHPISFALSPGLSVTIVSPI
jgi:hypothetical protein